MDRTNRRNRPKPLDIDQDGVPDKEDRCRRKTDRRITDSDGVIDRLDKARASGPSENGGCPDTDSDSDGVVDRLDKCPNESVRRSTPAAQIPTATAMASSIDSTKCPQQRNGQQLPRSRRLPRRTARRTWRFVDKKLEACSSLPTKADLVPSSFAVLDQAVAALKKSRPCVWKFRATPTTSATRTTT